MTTLFATAGALLLLPLALSQAVPVNEPAPAPQTSFEVVQPIPPPPTFEQEAHALALALYFEGNTNESKEGLQAIASVIVNRRNSPYFPDTIKEVVAHGAGNGKTNGGCQFSFMCDQYPEDIELLCQLRPLDLEKYWGENACQKRWDAYYAFAVEYLTSGQDNTDNANMYYAVWMGRPYWYRDLIRGSIVRRGSHMFGRSRHFEVKVALQ